MRNYRATVEYDGTDYSGFQIQVDRATIQGELERALQRITQQPVRICGAGRTDAGVHAHGQVVSFRADWAHSCEDMQRAMNAVLPGDIAVRDLQIVADDFHARFSASSRSYVYNLYYAPERSPFLDRWMCRLVQAVDLAAMSQAAAILEGEHDFSAFGRPPGGENAVRNVYRAAWHRASSGIEGYLRPAAARIIRFEIEGNAFLRGMVRRLVSTMLLVGVGSLSVDDFADILASRDIHRAGAPMRPCGLWLWTVRYGYGGSGQRQGTVGALASQDAEASIAQDRRSLDS